MTRQFKVGDRVIIDKHSEYYGVCPANPKDTLGTVQRIDPTMNLRISVKWDDTGVNNSYNPSDLKLVSGDNYQETLCELIEKKKVFTVDKEFVMQAHESACSTWKYKIEKKFPELFKDQFAKLTSDDHKHTRLYYKSDSDKGYSELNYNIALIDGIAGSYPEVPTSARFRGLYIHDRFDELDLELVRVHDGHAIVFKKKK